MSVREHLQAIHDKYGTLTPALVVDEARDKAHPLHSRFEWNNGLAAEAWRREQASQLIRSVRVVYRKPDTDQRLEIRAFHAIRGEEGNSYEPTDKVVNDPVLRAIVLKDMEREWRQLHQRYSDFEEFWQLVKAELMVAA